MKWCCNIWIVFGHRERKDCLFSEPPAAIRSDAADSSWVQRAVEGKTIKGEASLPPPETSLQPHSHQQHRCPPYQQEKNRTTRSNFKCNSATTPINLNVIPQRRSCNILQAEDDGVVVFLPASPKCRLCIKQHESFVNRFVNCCCSRRARSHSSSFQAVWATVLLCRAEAARLTSRETRDSFRNKFPQTST